MSDRARTQSSSTASRRPASTPPAAPRLIPPARVPPIIIVPSPPTALSPVPFPIIPAAPPASLPIPIASSVPIAPVPVAPSLAPLPSTSIRRRGGWDGWRSVAGCWTGRRGRGEGGWRRSGGGGRRGEGSRARLIAGFKDLGEEFPKLLVTQMHLSRDWNEETLRSASLRATVATRAARLMSVVQKTEEQLTFPPK
jgi:hypothetical protein